MTTFRSSRLALAAGLLALILTGCSGVTELAPSAATIAPAPAETPSAPALDEVVTPAEPPAAAPDAAATALSVLESIPVKGRAPKTGYSREEFGPAWKDVDRDGCDTRNQILNLDLTEIVHTNSVPCKVESGILNDPYTGKVIQFQRGQDTSSDVQIDHIVALSDAWQKGAQQLTADQRLQLANDPLNLRAADGPTNGAKGDGDAATWLPPNKGFRCEYVALQVAVKAKYQLWVTAAEHDAIARVLSSCPDQPLPAEGGATGPVAVDQVPAAAPAPVEATPVAEAPVAPAPASEVVYANCTEVKAAGAAPIHAGEPGFQDKFDRDGDGVGCSS